MSLKFTTKIYYVNVRVCKFKCCLIEFTHILWYFGKESGAEGTNGLECACAKEGKFFVGKFQQ